MLEVVLEDPRWRYDKEGKWRHGAYLVSDDGGYDSYDWSAEDYWWTPLDPMNLYLYSDSGCSCNSPYDGCTEKDLEVITNAEELKGKPMAFMTLVKAFKVEVKK